MDKATATKPKNTTFRWTKTFMHSLPIAAECSALHRAARAPCPPIDPTIPDILKNGASFR